MKAVIKSRVGFTMIEVLVVIALIVILVAIAVPSMRAWSIRHQRGAAASEIFALLNQARSMAISGSTSATITVNNNVTVPPGGNIVVAIGAPVNWARTLTFGAGPFNAVILTGVVPGGPFTISPRGTVTPGGFTLTLQDQDNRTANAAVGPLGDVTITIN